mmetsp:Transcript_15034/g.32584  ORF Transcript_15034/g.32584 Transcript_15034/m.32584 type:complete len:348 (+) Transcript_15034:277-1320(+)
MLNSTSGSDEYHMYQASDGSWVFLHTLNVRCLLHHYGSYETCPPTIKAQVLELEDMVQNEAIRKRYKFLSHLPLTGLFKLAEVDMGGLLPPESLAPFTEELTARERRRKKRAAEVRRQAAQEAAQARAAEAAKRGPSLQELAAMPLPSASLSQAPSAGAGGLSSSVAAAASALGNMAQGTSPGAGMSMGSSPVDSDLQMAIQASLEQVAGSPPSLGTSPPSGSVAWSHLVKMGFAATGPTLGTSPQGPTAALGPAPGGAWGAKPGAIAASAGGPGGSGPKVISSPGAWGSGAASTSKSGSLGGSGAGGASRSLAAGSAATTEGDASAGSVKKGKKGVLLFSTGQRRY